MKKVYLICFLSSLSVLLAAFLLHAVLQPEKKQIKIGYIFVGDEMTPYTENFMNAEEHVREVYGDRIESIVLYNVPEDSVEGPVRELIAQGCDYIIAPSYGYSTVVKQIAAEYPNIEFCVPTGDNANTDTVYPNYHNCMGTIYQGRYICGMVAGMKLKEMIDQGIITPDQAKIGYVAAFPYAEVISGYTAFFLGVQSVVPESTMLVKYTNTWSSYSLEKKVAQELIELDCVVISQHSDTTGPAVACESATGPIPIYHVGYNQSMTEFAPTRSLISCTIDYSFYFEQSVGALLADKKIEAGVNAKVYGQDSMAGFDKGWIKILDLNTAIAAPGTQEAIREKMDLMIKGKLPVFYGNYTGVNPFDSADTIDLHNEYIENDKSSSPTFHYVLDDVITIIP